MELRKGNCPVQGTGIEHKPGEYDCPACRNAYLRGYLLGSNGIEPERQYLVTPCPAREPEPVREIRKPPTIDRAALAASEGMVFLAEFAEDIRQSSAVRVVCVSCRRATAEVDGRHCGECFGTPVAH